MMRFLMLAALVAVLPAPSTFVLPAEAQLTHDMRSIEARDKAKCLLTIEIS